MYKSAAGCLVSFLLGYTPAAFGAEITLLSGAGSVHGDLILVEGELQGGDEVKFHNLAKNSLDATVTFNSPGGNLVAGLEIGAIAQKKQFKTHVGPSYMCASACALAWLAGQKRTLSETAVVGFHAAYTRTANELSVSSAGNALVGAYLNRLGLSDEAVIFITSAPPEGLQNFTFSDARKLGISVAKSDIDLVKYSRATSNGGNSDAAYALKLRTQEFVLADNLDDRKAMIVLGSMYANSVSFFGANMSKTDVLARKSRYFTNRPKRFVLLDPGSIAVSCKIEKSCTAEVNLSWELRGSLLKETGSGRLSLNWSYTGTSWNVISQKMQKL